jgi:hypothetical protein
LDGPALSAKFYYIWSIDVDGSGGVYVADKNNHRIRFVKNNAVSTVAGSGTAGFKNGPALAAEFHEPLGLAVKGGKIYVADRQNHAIRTVESGQVSTLAGTGVAGTADGNAATAQFNLPYEVAIGPSGKVYVADEANLRIRTIHNGVVSTLAGSVAGYLNGPAATALFDRPLGIAVDASSQVYVADFYNCRYRLITQ